MQYFFQVQKQCNRLLVTALIYCLGLLSLNCAQAALTIEITGGSVNQIPIAIVPFAGEARLPQGLTKVIAADLQRSGLFKLVDPNAVQPAPSEIEDVKYADWSSRGADALVIGSVVPRSDGKLEVRFRLLDVLKQNQLTGVSYTIAATPIPLRATAHQIADVIYEKLTGDIGVFSTRIAYVVKKGKNYELQVADADGYNPQTILGLRESIISVSWAPDGSKLAYVSFENKKPVIYIQSLLNGERRALGSFKGNSSAPAWSPDGRQLCIALSSGGGSQLYLVNADGSGLKRLSNSSAIDTEPAWSSDGKWILFTSDRGGKPQIYRISTAGGEAQRLTFEGDYNVSPHVSPDGKSFTFIHKNGGRYSVAIQDIGSNQMQILTDTSLDESPSFSPNGKTIIYATEGGGRGVLAAVSSDGRVKQRLSTQGGDIREPAWGPLSKNP